MEVIKVAVIPQLVQVPTTRVLAIAVEEIIIWVLIVALEEGDLGKGVAQALYV